MSLYLYQKQFNMFLIYEYQYLFDTYIYLFQFFINLI